MEAARGGRDRPPSSARAFDVVALTGLGLTAVLVASIYGDVVLGMVRDWWDDPNHSHGFLVPVVSAYLLWERRERVREAIGDGTSAGFVLLLAGLSMLVVGTVGAEDFLRRSSLIPVLAGLVLLHGGPRLLGVTAFPLAYLLLMIPLPFLVLNAIAFPLQALAARNATWALDVLGVSVFRDGNVIHLAHATLGVTEACSGIRSLVSLIALALAWAALAGAGAWGSALFVAAAVPITIFANAVRVVATGLIGQWFGIRYAEGFFHGFSGWVIFVVAALCLLGLDRLLRRFRRTA
jgi:exosortase